MHKTSNWPSDLGRDGNSLPDSLRLGSALALVGVSRRRSSSRRGGIIGRVTSITLIVSGSARLNRLGG